MDITWLGHACFRLKGRDATVLTDPYGRSIGLSLPRQSADVITISQSSPNHAAADLVANDPRVVRGPGEYEVGGVMLVGVATAGPAGEDGKPIRNTAFAITIDDLVVCHLGSLARPLAADQLEALKDPDVLLMPVDREGHLTPAAVAEVISQLEPKFVIPMQYQVPGFNLKLEPIDRFCREMGVQEPRYLPKLGVTRSSVPDEATVVLLEPAVARR